MTNPAKPTPAWNTRPLRILLVDDEEIIHQTIGDYLTDLGHILESARNGQDGLQSAERGEFDLALVDIRMPGLDGLALLPRLRQISPDLGVVLISGHGSMETVINALRLGALDYLTKPIKLRELEAVLEKASRLQAMQSNQNRLRETIAEIQGTDRPMLPETELIGTSRLIENVRRQIRQAIEARCPSVLILGETGTGKEVVARNLHFQAHPPHSPFIAVNCPALPESLAESELFGHMKGAFTGAIQNKPGVFELADGGTLFFDEIADLSLPMQAKILRTLESRTLRRIGGTREIGFSTQIIAASNVDLATRTTTGTFRQDLLYRINLLTIYLPPLRERREDIPLLAHHFLQRFLQATRRSHPGISPEALLQLQTYSFPGNIRELRNLIERALMVCGNQPISPEHFSFSSSVQTQQPLSPFKPSLPETKAGLPPASEEDPEARQLRAALESVRWNRREAARVLGMPYSTLRYKIQRLRID